MDAVTVPWQVWAVLNKEEGFHSGYIDKAQAEACLADTNKRAAEMGIKTRYILKDMTPKVAATTTVEAPMSSQPAAPSVAPLTVEGVAT